MRLLEGRVVLVAGAGPGLGRETALLAAAHGADVVVAARTASRLEALAQEVAALGGRALAVPTDVTDRAQCRRLADTVGERFGRLDGLVNNGFAPNRGGGLLATYDRESWLRIFDVNYFGALEVTRATVDLLAGTGDGRVVMISSMAVAEAEPSRGAYAASKAALEAQTRMLAKELGPRGIRVNAVQPGWMQGPAVDAYLARTAADRGVDTAEVAAGIVADIALGAMPTDEEVAGSVVFLLSPLARPVTGAVLVANGGHVI
jgi:NAD(P)-dependent dehydrogenase (short-subunit alcohol dehydrogenase family)